MRKRSGIRDEIRFFQEVRAGLAKSTVEGEGKTIEEMDTAIRQLVSRAVVSDEVIDIFAVAGLKKPDISILSDDFLQEVRQMPHRNLAGRGAEKAPERRNKNEITQKHRPGAFFCGDAGECRPEI